MIPVMTVLIVIFLAVQVLPAAIGLNLRKGPATALLFVLITTIVQTLVFLGGYKLGSAILHLTAGFKEFVFFIGFFLIGIRMFMEILNVRKGLRTFEVDAVGTIVFISLAQAINTLLAGLLLFYVPGQSVITLSLILGGSVLIMTTAGLWINPGKMALSGVSLLYFVGGLIMIVSSIYIGFFAL